MEFLGTPDDRIWPGVTNLPDYKSRFPKWPTQIAAESVKRLDDRGRSLFNVFI